MKKYFYRLLVLLLIFFFIQTSLSTDTLAADDVVQIDVSDDVFRDDFDSYPNGYTDLGNQIKNELFVGHEDDYGASEAFLKFNLSSIDTSRTIESAELNIYVVKKFNNPTEPFLNLHGSYNDSWSEPTNDPGAPFNISKDVVIILNEAVQSGVNPIQKTIDVTDFITDEAAKDKTASFVLSGATSGTEVVFSFFDKAYNNGEYAANLVVTYVPAYTVSYDGNGSDGGSSPTDSNAYEQDDTVTVMDNTGNLTRTGYTFAGWNTAANGSGTTYVAGNTFPMGAADVTLYAQWTVNSYTVSYNGNGSDGGSAPSDVTYNYSSTVTVSGNTGNLTRTGYTFTGWNTASDGSGTSYAANDTVTMGAANVTLYAQWTINSYTVSFDSQGGSAVAGVSADYGTTISAPSDPTKEGYTFAGWYKEASITNAWDFAADMVTEDTTLYAQWTINSYTVSYYGNGHDEGTAPSNESPEYNSSVTVSGNTGNLTRTGYTFVSWNTAADGSGTAYAAGNTFTMGAADVTLYAQWAINSYTVRFDSEGGSAVADVSADYGTTITAPSDPTKESYTFAGWYKEVSLTETWDFASDTVTGDTTLHAKWTVDVPGVPVIQSAVAGDTEVSLSWSSVSGATGYHIYKRTASESYGAALETVTSSVYSYTVTGLTNGTTYSFVLKAVNAGGQSPASNEVSATPQELSSNANLNGLTLSSGTLSPAIDGSITHYKVNVTNSVTSITVTPIVADSNAVVTVNGTAVTSGSPSGAINLNSGDNTLEFKVIAQDGTTKVYIVTVTRAEGSTGTPSGGTSSPDRNTVPAPTPTDLKLAMDPKGGVILITDPSIIEKVTRLDGTIVEKVTLDKETLDEALALLEDAVQPILTILVDDSEGIVQVQLPAASIAATAGSFPNAIIEVKLNGASYQLVISAFNLEGFAEQFGVELKDLKVNVILERADESTEKEILQLAVMEGFDLASAVIDFKVTVKTNGRTVEIGDFGGMYMARAIVTDGDIANRNLTGVLYDPVTKKFAFVPSHLGVRMDGTREIVMKVPHNSMYAVLESKGQTFADLSGHWAKEDVELLASKLIAKGVTDSHFAPDADITRAEFAALLTRSLGLSLNQSGETSRFVDVAADAWYAPAVGAAVKAGLVSGMSSDRFAPDERITREQMTVMIANALAFAGKTDAVTDGEVLVKFADRESISNWAEASVAEAVKAGIVIGMSGNTIAPAEHATRAQAVVMLKRFLQYVAFID